MHRFTTRDQFEFYPFLSFVIYQFIVSVKFEKGGGRSRQAYPLVLLLSLIYLIDLVIDSYLSCFNLLVFALIWQKAAYF